jgi:uncharacterized protein YjiS (DUF1127 family)
MRDAALTIAALGDDFAPSLAARALAAATKALAALRRARAARRHLAQLRRLDPAHLADIGLAPTDVAALDPRLSALEATRRLADAAATRRHDRLAEERWSRG